MTAEHLATRQYGLITLFQALAAGLTIGQIEHRCRIGRWRVVRPGVYVVVGTPPSWEQQVLAAVLASGSTAVASHGTAARLLGLDVGAIDAIELTTSRPRQVRLDGVVGHRSFHLFDCDHTRRAGIPCTTVARTVVDLSNRVDEPSLGKALDGAQRRRQVRLGEVHRCVGRLGPAPGRSPKKIERVLARRWPGYDPGDSDLETRVLRLIVAAGLPLPRQQYRVQVQGRRFRLDLAYPDRLIGIELDGWEFHKTRSAFDDDRVRDDLLRLAGWTIYHFTSTMTDEFIVATIAAALGLSTVGALDRV